jgi:hypothetical protein
MQGYLLGSKVMKRFPVALASGSGYQCDFLPCFRKYTARRMFVCSFAVVLGVIGAF